MSSSEIDKKPYYVALTGSKNNAGDYLIKYRAKKLLAELRPDRELIDVDAWNRFSKETLALVNGAKAVILLGGPALQKEMYPNIYKLTENIDDISVPIVTMGIGWKSMSGDWEDTYKYPLSEKTKRLLDKIESSGYQSSVRDFHTMNSLRMNGYKSFSMTGCPALFDLEHLKNPNIEKNKIQSVGFSLGVSFLDSAKMQAQMKELVIKLQKHFVDSKFKVVFHHSLSDKFLSTHNATNKHLAGHRKFAQWLDENKIEYIDISGSEQNLIKFYQSVDLHIGYRVHAHIYMSSIGKRSILISEDGRGTGLKDVLGGLVFKGYQKYQSTKLSRALKLDRYKAHENFADDILNNIDYEIGCDFKRTHQAQVNILEHFRTMKEFINQLP